MNVEHGGKNGLHSFGVMLVIKIYFVQDKKSIFSLVGSIVLNPCTSDGPPWMPP